MRRDGGRDVVWASSQRAAGQTLGRQHHERGRHAQDPAGRGCPPLAVAANPACVRQASQLRHGLLRPGAEEGIVAAEYEIVGPSSARVVEDREDEFGDLLFSLVNVARKLGMNPEDALRAATGRFEARFRMMEQKAKAQGRDLKDLPIEELDQYWEAAKRNR